MADVLTPLTSDQITKQARNSVNAAYAPAYADLNNQRNQAMGLQQKRDADNKSYRTWLDGKMQLLQAQNDAAHQQLMGALGGVSAPGESSYGAPGANGQLVDNAKAQALTGADISNNLVSATRENTYAYERGQEAKQRATLDATLQGISENRMKLNLGKVQDIQKAIADTQASQIKLAEDNRNYGLKVDTFQEKTTNDTRNYGLNVAKYDLQRANVSSMISDRAVKQQLAAGNQQIAIARLNLDGQKYNLSISQEQYREMSSDRNYQLNAAKFGAQQAREQYLKDHHLGVYKPANSTKPSQDKIDAGKVKVQQGTQSITGAANVNYNPFDYFNNYGKGFNKDGTRKK